MEPAVSIRDLTVRYGDFTAVDHLDLSLDRGELFGGLYGAPEERIDACLALVELTDAADLPVRGYSLGMRRKLLLARALLHRPRILYLDEPTANLDIHSAEIVHRILRGLTAEGVTVLL